MAFTVTARGGLGKLDPLDNSLVLLSLHSACLGVAGGFLGKSELSQTFNIPWMLTGFTIGAVLAVLAGYYGLINNGALRDYLASAPSDAIPSELSRGIHSVSSVEGDASETLARSEFDMVPPAYAPPARRSRPLLGPSVVTAICAVVVVWALFAFGPAADVTGEAREKDQLRAFAIAGTLAVILAPLPLIWTRPSRVIAASKNALLLGSLLTFVLSVTIAMVPAAAASIAEVAADLNQGPTVREAAREIEIRVLQVPNDGPGSGSNSGSDDRSEGTRGGTTDGGADDGNQRGGSTQAQTSVSPELPTRADIDRLELEMRSLEGRVVSAINAKEIRVEMPAPTLQAPITFSPNVAPAQPVVVNQVGERGEPGRAAPVRECEWVWALWPRECRYVDQPPQLPAAAPATPF